MPDLNPPTGHHVDAPFWKGSNPKSRMLKTSAEMKRILTAEEVETLSVDEINARINAEFRYDDYKWQKDNKIRIRKKNRAEGFINVGEGHLTHSDEGFRLEGKWKDAD